MNNLEKCAASIFRAEDGCNIYLHHAGTSLSNYMASYSTWSYITSMKNH
jgi:hypothetical protein